MSHAIVYWAITFKVSLKIKGFQANEESNHMSNCLRG